MRGLKLNHVSERGPVLILISWPFKPKGYCRWLCPSVRKLYLVRMVTSHIFELESPNLAPNIHPDHQGHFGHFDSEF